MEGYDVNKSIQAQADYCEKKDAPHFAPESGVCWKCKQNIYAPITQKNGDREYVSGITVEKATNSLVTGCPHCHRSYCE